LRSHPRGGWQCSGDETPNITYQTQDSDFALLRLFHSFIMAVQGMTAAVQELTAFGELGFICVQQHYEPEDGNLRLQDWHISAEMLIACAADACRRAVATEPIARSESSVESIALQTRCVTRNWTIF
jgi:hypothetical protein